MKTNNNNERGYTRLLDCMNTYSIRESVVRLGIDILRSLVLYRKSGIYHVVITPKDIYVSPSGEFRLETTPLRVIEHTGEFTQAIQLYIAPEVSADSKSEASVIYSLGTIMYRLMNGGMEPFRETPDYEGALKAYSRRMDGLRLSAPANADASLSAIILKACEYDVDLRYNSIEEMLNELKMLADGNYQRKTSDSVKKSDSEKKKPIKKTPVILSAVLSAIVFVGVVLLCVNYHCDDIYVKAERRLRDEKFDLAKEMFEEISWYKDSETMVLKCDYKKADYLLDNGQTDESLKIYKYLSDVSYDDSQKRYNNALLKKAEELKAEGKTDEAIKIITSVAQGNDKNANDVLNEHKHNTAIELYNKGEYAMAKKIFIEIGDNEMADECDYCKASLIKDEGKYAEAMEIFSSLGDYNDSPEKFKQCEKWLMIENEDSFSSYKELVGRYSNDDGRYVEYITDDGTMRAKYNLPFESGAYFKIEDGVHYHSNDTKEWKKQWILERVSSTEIMVYDYISEKSYTLKTQ